MDYIDLHGVHLGSCKSLPNPSDLHGGADQVVPRKKDWRIASSYIRHWR